MRRFSTSVAWGFALLACLLLLRIGLTVAEPTSPILFGMSEMPGNASQPLRKLLPSVVSISIHRTVTRDASATNASGGTPNASDGTPHIERFYGSGFIIDPSGVIATNYHVVRDAQDIEVTFHDGARVPAHLLKATQLIDVALIKVDMDHKLPAVSWGDSDKLQVGDPVFAVGNALSVGISVSGGLVSGLNRNIMDSPYDDYIQTDAAINHGNSGGPLVDANGKVVGIDTAIVSPTQASAGVGFAIPSHNARDVITRLMQYGWLRPGWIGVKIQELTPDMGLALGLSDPRGSIVANVAPEGPAAAGGLRVGDVIVRFGSEAPSDERALLRAIATAPIGQDIVLGVLRNGKPLSLRVAIKEWPRSSWDRFDAPVSALPPHHNVPPDLGITLASLDAANRAQYGITLTQSGIVVTGVAADTDAAQRGLARGDVILEINAKPVSGPEDVRAALDQARAQKRDFVVALIQPKVSKLPGPQWVALRVADN
jgi:serine protease Do